ncbi:MAG: TetR/AcrR family transcriptional regulator [Sporolactobacillus sp.]
MDGKQRIAEQSRLWLVDAFFELLHEQSYDAITITAIVDRAQLSRRTFYRSFSSKNALLNYYSQLLFKDYLSQLQSMNPYTYKKVLVIFFEFWWSKKERLCLLIDQGLFYALLYSASKHSEKIYSLFKAPWHIVGNEYESQSIMRFVTGGFWNVLYYWATEDEPKTPEEMADIIIKGITALSKGISAEQ